MSFISVSVMNAATFRKDKKRTDVEIENTR